MELSVNPGHIVTVQDFSAGTIERIVDHLEVSTDFEHLVYREAELDALWSLTGFSAASESIARLRAGVEQAHDLVADRRPAEAAKVLRRFL